MKHILSVDQFSKKDIESIFASAHRMKEQCEHGDIPNGLIGKISANLFYEPSTRTSSSFAAAMYRLGGNVISINDVQYSSVAKGETLEDTVRTLEQYSDVIILRHPEVGSAAKAAAVARVPIINAGDGIGEHPTQALLDLFTIYDEHGRIDGLEIAMLGDLKNGRTVHSLAKLLNHYDVNLTFVAPKELRFGSTRGIKNVFEEVETLDKVLSKTDVLYVTRVQKERFDDLAEYEAVKNSYVIDTAAADAMKSSSIIMHPLPRVGEISFDVDENPRAAYFREMKNGLYIRMALLDYCLN